MRGRRQGERDIGVENWVLCLDTEEADCGARVSEYAAWISRGRRVCAWTSVRDHDDIRSDSEPMYDWQREPEAGRGCGAWKIVKGKVSKVAIVDSLNLLSVHFIL